MALRAPENANGSLYRATQGEGVTQRRRLFHPTFVLEERAEGMTTFVEERLPGFRNR